MFKKKKKNCIILFNIISKYVHNNNLKIKLNVLENVIIILIIIINNQPHDFHREN